MKNFPSFDDFVSESYNIDESWQVDVSDYLKSDARYLEDKDEITDNDIDDVVTSVIAKYKLKEKPGVIEKFVKKYFGLDENLNEEYNPKHRKRDEIEADIEASSGSFKNKKDLEAEHYKNLSDIQKNYKKQIQDILPFGTCELNPENCSINPLSSGRQNLTIAWRNPFRWDYSGKATNVDMDIKTFKVNHWSGDIAFIDDEDINVVKMLNFILDNTDKFYQILNGYSKETNDEDTRHWDIVKGHKSAKDLNDLYDEYNSLKFDELIKAGTIVETQPFKVHYGKRRYDSFNCSKIEIVKVNPKNALIRYYIPKEIMDAAGGYAYSSLKYLTGDKEYWEQPIKKDELYRIWTQYGITGEPSARVSEY